MSPDSGPGEAHDQSSSAPARFWSGYQLIWLLLASFLAMIFAVAAAQAIAEQAGFDRIRTIILTTFAASLSTLGPVALLVLPSPARRRSAGLVPTSIGQIGRAPLYMLALLPVNLVLSLLLEAVTGLEDHPQADMLLDQMSAVQLVTVALMTVVIVPFAEELIFRGVLLSYLLERGPSDPTRRTWAAVLVSSLVFGLVHVDPLLIPGTTALGIAAALLRLRTGSLWPAIALHQLNNALATVVLASGAV